MNARTSPLCSQVLEYLEARNFALASYYHIAIDALGRCRRYKEAVELFRSERCPKTTFTYNVVMQIYTRQGKIQKAEAVFKEMRAAGVAVEARTYNVLIDFYSKQKGGFDKALVSRPIDGFRCLRCFRRMLGSRFQKRAMLRRINMFPQILCRVA